MVRKKKKVNKNNINKNKKNNINNNNKTNNKINNSNNKNINNDKNKNSNKTINNNKIVNNSINKKEEKKEKKRKKAIVIISSLIIVLLIIASFNIYYFYIDIIKKDISIELGTDTIALEDVFKHGIKKNSSFLTDLNSIDFKHTGNYKIAIKAGNQTEETTLHIVDTVAPLVTFQDVQGYLEYEFDPKDFVKEVTDLSDVTISAENIPEYHEYGEYKVVIVVKDASGNETKEERTLFIGAMRANITLELGDTLKKEDLVYAKEHAKYISQKDLTKINKSDVGTYEITAEIEGKTFTSKIEVVDTTAPVLKLKDVSIYDDTKKIETEDFIKSVTDASTYEVSLKTEIPYGQIGKYEIAIEAVDKYGNKTTETTELTIKKDNDAPVISGLTNLKTNKNTSPNYLKGVKAVDKKDGNIDVTVDASEVKLDTAGIYYVTYTATDKAGNKASKKRQVEVKHDQSDTNKKVKEVANSLNNDLEAITKYVDSSIRYYNSWGEDDAVWYGLTNKKGNCYVYASVLKAILNVKGYESQFIWTTDKSHYWLLVNVNGTWWHFNPVSGQSFLNDEAMQAVIPKKTWDKTAWPQVG